ncbi:hypothetical protein IGI04_025820 [Brassica rapa subsp. trilocularis]|uniref:Uncharacterized protein n=1 Tax=Brassica rapa subsp. trilocularis TaxID=1813537 RepID=A0ABQ7KU67_BRACM|nr:hypothetical protein IGI04_025820 [Brassica rapa subsp. trilocularis]
MFKEIRERLESFRARNITFLLQSFERKKENKTSGRLMKDSWKTYVRFMEDLWKTYERLMEDLCKIHERLMEDFDLGEKPKLFQNLDLIHEKTFSGKLLEDLWKTYGRLLENLWKTPRRLM